MNALVYSMLHLLFCYKFNHQLDLGDKFIQVSLNRIREYLACLAYIVPLVNRTFLKPYWSKLALESSKKGALSLSFTRTNLNLIH